MASATSLPRSPTALTIRDFHFAGGFFGEGEAEDVFAEERRIGFQQVADALGDDAGFAGARARDDEERPIAVGDGALLRFVQLRAARFRLTHFE